MPSSNFWLFVALVCVTIWAVGSLGYYLFLALERIERKVDRLLKDR